MKKRGFIPILIIILLSSALLFLYLKNIAQNEFLKGVYGVYILHKDKKIVFADGLYLTNGGMDKASSKKVVSYHVNEPPKIIRVPFYNQDYIVVERPMGEGTYDYVIFDGDGNVITNRLLSDNYGELGKILGANIENLRDDGTLILKVADSNNKNSYLVKFDLITGKYKGKI